MSASPFATLPPDCWWEIMLILPFHDVESVSRTSRELRALAEPILYRCINWDWKTLPLCRILRLLRTISQRPALATYIKEVYLLSSLNDSIEKVWVWTAPLHWWFQARGRFEEVMKYAMDIILQAQLPDKRMWTTALLGGNVYAFASILLSQLPNLRVLHLDFTFVIENGLPGLMLNHALFVAPRGTLSCFQKLETVSYGANAPLLYCVDWVKQQLQCRKQTQFTAWFYLPALQNLEIWLYSLHSLKLRNPPRQRQWNLANLRKLILWRCVADEEDIQLLLSHMSSLKTLHLGIIYTHWQELTTSKRAQVFLHGLESVSKTLEALSLSVEESRDSGGNINVTPENEAFMQPFHGFLKRFPRLRSAEVPRALLVGNAWNAEWEALQNVLPETLGDLCLRTDLYDQHLRSFEGQILHCLYCIFPDIFPDRDAVPSLRHSLRHITFPIGSGWASECLEELEFMCKKAGFEMHACVKARPPGIWTRRSF